ncbi:MAG: hypothetical protein Q4D26_08520 [Clostridia bacterium]|nr:hypothetical protein [Clostridia bacterium]
MRYYENIILDKNISSIETLLKSRIARLDYYAVCVSDIGTGLMEIISLGNALKGVNAYKNYGIIAVIKGKFAAENLSAKLIEDWLKNNEDLKEFKEFYNSKCK